MIPKRDDNFSFVQLKAIKRERERGGETERESEPSTLLGTTIP
jgi:hypothetical protein